MSRDLDELTFFENPDIDRLAQLVFDLAAQLHIERQRRLALETLLIRAGAVSGAELAALAENQDFLAEARAGLDASQRRLLTILIEAGDRRTPLRAESRSVAGGADEAERS
jgi:hypothetical protein